MALPSSHYICYRKDGTETKHITACFAQLNSMLQGHSYYDNLGRSVKPEKKNEVIKVKLFDANAPILEQKEFMDVVQKAFPKGMIEDDGTVNMGYQADLFVFALCLMRHPTEYGYINSIPAMLEGIKASYKKLGKKPPFKLSAPLVAALCNLNCRAKDGMVTGAFGTGHDGADWGQITFGDLWALSEADHFTGCQPNIGTDRKGWELGYSSVVTTEKVSGRYIGGQRGDRKDKNYVSKAYHDWQKSARTDSWSSNFPSHKPEEMYDWLFSAMIKNKP